MEPFWVLYPIPVSREFTVSMSSLSLHPQLEPVFPQLGDSHLQMLSCIKEKPFLQDAFWASIILFQGDAFLDLPVSNRRRILGCLLIAEALRQGYGLST